jgi:undecaprenyl diphosphate synthase
VIEAAAEIGVGVLTLFAFSTENWSRPKKEVDTLMSLLSRSLKNELKKLQDNDIQLRAIGDLTQLPNRVRRELEEVIQLTSPNRRMILNLALSYGSRKEITHAVQRIAQKAIKGDIHPDNIDEQMVMEHLYTSALPDVDFLIRTSGEQRISNFLLWQIAYAELYFTDIMWPDFKKINFYQAIKEYQQRERRFGRTAEQINKKKVL